MLENIRGDSRGSILPLRMPSLLPHDLCHEWNVSRWLPARKQQLELDMEQQTDSKQEKEYVKAVYCHPAYLTSMQSTSCEMPGWMKHKLESRLPGEISIATDTQMTSPLWQKVKRNWRASWWKWKWRVKSWLKTQHSEIEDHGIWSHHFMANRLGNNGNRDRLYFLVLQNQCRWWLQAWN